MEPKPRPPKAYKNNQFLNSPAARTIRILAEYHEPQDRFVKYDIRSTLVFFGSARSRDSEATEALINETNPSPEKSTHMRKLARYHDDAVELARRLTEWSITNGNGKKQSHYICSGGGPGMMEAANKGAYLAGGKSIGLNISIPMEQYPNPYISDELTFEFHYFFIRKFWFVYLAQAAVIFPGGFGTLDEFMELITLIQTHKIKRDIPIVVYGKEYWQDVLNLEALERWGTISAADLDLLHFSDDVSEAFDYITARIK